MFTIIGFRFYDFEADGKIIKGVKVFLTRPDDSVEGLLCESCSLSSHSIGYEEFIEELSVGKECEIFYNKYGKVSYAKIYRKEII